MKKDSEARKCRFRMMPCANDSCNFSYEGVCMKITKVAEGCFQRMESYKTNPILVPRGEKKMEVEEKQIKPKEIEKLVDGGKRISYGNGAIREPSTGKGRFDLMSPQALLRLAKHYENGAAKYKERNWEKGIPASRCLDSAFRHLTQFLAGNADEDHLAAAVWNIFCIMTFEETKPEGMLDLPRYKTKED